MGRKRSDLKERVIETADRLFYTDGFGATGVARIAEEAGTNKVSLYHYFPSKRELGREYFRRANRRLLRDAIDMMRRSRDPHRFVSRWFNLLKRNCRNDPDYNGCPLVNYVSQLEHSQREELAYVRRIMRRWLFLLILYFEREKRGGRLHSSVPSASLARSIFAAHEGAIISWKLTGDLQVFDDARSGIERLFAS